MILVIQSSQGFVCNFSMLEYLQQMPSIRKFVLTPHNPAFILNFSLSRADRIHPIIYKFYNLGVLVIATRQFHIERTTNRNQIEKKSSATFDHRRRIKFKTTAERKTLISVSTFHAIFLPCSLDRQGELRPQASSDKLQG